MHFKRSLIFFIAIFLSGLAIAQEMDSAKSVSAAAQDEGFAMADTLGKNEFSPLDIGSNRGLFIVTKDQKMQLRILGSIRFAVLYDFVNFPLKKVFNSYFMPVGEERVSIPNYYGDLNQSRIGFEITRKIKNKNVFIRLETDFNRGLNGTFRIRHAYGQYNKYLVGQTWSLFSNVTALPRTVNLDGPAGSVILRTPQMRYFNSFKKGIRWAVALEYTQPDINFQVSDTVSHSSVQIIPDLTARIEKEGIFGAVQLSGVMTTLSLLNENNEVTNKVGFGASLSGTIDFETSRILYQMAYGQSISQFITTFNGTGRDAIFNPDTGSFDPLVSFGGFIAYDYNWLSDLASNLAVGFADLNTKSYQIGTDFNYSMSVGLNTFWEIAEGFNIGLEYTYAHRWNIDHSNGGASRIAALFYYDF